MKKFWIIFMVILGFIAIGIFSTSFGNEENQTSEMPSASNIRNSDCGFT